MPHHIIDRPNLPKLIGKVHISVAYHVQARQDAAVPISGHVLSESGGRGGVVHKPEFVQHMFLYVHHQHGKRQEYIELRYSE